MAVAIGACGGGSGGGGSGGGGSGGGGGNGGGGNDDCGPEPEGVDCICNDELFGPSCVGGQWVCEDCPDVTCGGTSGKTCGPDMFCAFFNRTCGADEPGECTPVSLCLHSNTLSCGCDGKVYADLCAAAAAGQDGAASGGCVPPAGTFACGYALCHTNTEYCAHTDRSAIGDEDSWQCVPTPSSCSGTADCGCIPKQGVCKACQEEGPGQVVVTCTP
ncbi:MAG: hypothetical protein QM820_31665 [Minicystis sp.]